VPDKNGDLGLVYTGNGLLSVLRAISVLQDTGADIQEIVHPFPPGSKDSRYVYFVDKSRFYRGSSVWNEDEKIAMEILERGVPAGYSVRRLDFADDPQMLYLACLNPEGNKEGALFVRNAGTEMKTCVTLRCAQDLYPSMREAMIAIHALNRKLMKDASSRDAAIEALILGALGKKNLPLEELKALAEASFGGEIRNTDFLALLFAMRKEGLLGVSGVTVERLEE